MEQLIINGEKLVFEKDEDNLYIDIEATPESQYTYVLTSDLKLFEYKDNEYIPLETEDAIESLLSILMNEKTDKILYDIYENLILDYYENSDPTSWLSTHFIYQSNPPYFQIKTRHGMLSLPLPTLPIETKEFFTELITTKPKTQSTRDKKSKSSSVSVIRLHRDNNQLLPLDSTI